MRENDFTKWHQIMSIADKENWACKPSPPDERDFPLSFIAEPLTLPSSVRLDSLFTKIRDQGSCGVCVGKAVASAMSAGFNNILSSLYIYGRCKQEDGIPNQQ